MSKQNESAAVKAPPSVAPAYILRLAGTLAGICLVAAALLGAVNQVTRPRIDAIRTEKTEAAMAQVLAADEYISLDRTLPDRVTALYQANAGGFAIGWIAAVTSSGSQGAIDIMVGIGTDGLVTGVSVVSHSETPNIGTRVVSDQSVLDRFIGMSHAGGEITVGSGSGPADGAVPDRFDAVSGATVSSRGVTAGVNAALRAVEPLL